MSQVIFVEGPDRLGKTELTRRLSRMLRIPTFKAPTEVKNWKEGAFCVSIPFDWMLTSFVKQLDISFISDRGYASEIVYSKVYGRPTNDPMLADTDTKWGEQGAVTVILHPGTISLDELPDDELVERFKMREIVSGYEHFSRQTATRCIMLYVSDYLLPRQPGTPLRWDIDRMAADVAWRISTSAHEVV